MVGFNFGSLFKQQPIYDNQGSLVSIGQDDYAGKYQTQVRASVEVTGNTATSMYTVAAGKVFFLVNVNVSMDTDAANDIQFDLLLSPSTEILMSWLSPAAITNTWEIVSISLKMPLRIPAGETIGIGCDHANGHAIANISGWLEDA